MSGVAVAKVILDQPEIVAPIRESEAAGVPEHVRMDRRQSGSLRRGRDQVIDGLTGERLAAFGYEEPGEPVRTGFLIVSSELQGLYQRWCTDKGMMTTARAANHDDPVGLEGDI